MTDPVRLTPGWLQSQFDDVRVRAAADDLYRWTRAQREPLPKRLHGRLLAEMDRRYRLATGKGLAERD